MPVQPTYPGVYVEELPSGVRNIAGVSTSVTAFIGRARKGPLNEPLNIFNMGDYERHFGGLWEKSPMSFAVRDFFLNGGGEAVIVRIYNPVKDDDDKEISGLSEITFSLGTDTAPDALKLVAANPGSWGNRLSVKIDHLKDDKLLNVTITEAGGASEKFLNASVDAGSANYLPNLLEQSSSLMRVAEMSTVRPPQTKEKEENKAENGNDGLHITDGELIGGSHEKNKTGIYALQKTDIFNLLCIPPYESADPASNSFSETDKATDVTTDLIAAAAAYCQKRRAMLIVDPHSSWDRMAAAQEHFTKENDAYPGTNTDYAALFFPRLKQANPLRNNQMEEFVPCGAIAGIIARTDTQRGVWKAPAGTDATLSGVNGFSVSLTDDENGKLNQLGMNCLRAFPVYGRLVWGARTLAGADQLSSQWKYLPVRRTALYIEESLFRGLKWVVFEPNDEPLWAQIRLNVGAFMHNLFRQGAFQGQKKEAYFVKCDSETTTQNDINNGIVNILVGFAPLKPAEFVIIKLQQLASQVEI